MKKKLIIIASIIISIIGIILFLLYGPYSGFRTFWITTAMTTKSHQYLAKIFYSDEVINDVLESNKIIEPENNTDMNLINTDKTNNTIYKDIYDKEILEKEDNDLYKIIEIDEKSYKGYLAVIYDPSKVKLATTKYSYKGEYLVDMAKDNNAVLAINGGGFIDLNGEGDGGSPVGIVIKDGKIINNTSSGKGIIGLTNDNKLYLGKITANEAINIGIRDAVEFGPFLIVNGEKSKIVGNGGYGLHPRSAIGQREDGIILFLVIDGRSITSLGADMDDLIYIMDRYGAVNAANLDGGNSSALVENGVILNNPIDWYNQNQTRPIPNGFIVVE